MASTGRKKSFGMKVTISTYSKTKRKGSDNRKMSKDTKKAIEELNKTVKQQVFNTGITNTFQFAVGQLAGNAVRVRQKQLRIAAIFFQRLIARTPVDENYKKISSKGKERFHKADSYATRDNWILQIGSTSIKSDKYSSLCEEVGNETAIDTIYTDLVNLKVNVDRGFSVINTSDYFEILEYGGYSRFNKGRKDVPGMGNKRIHGTIEGYSLQAPAGMYRLTVAEMDQIIADAQHWKGSVENFDNSPTTLERFDGVAKDLGFTYDNYEAFTRLRKSFSASQVLNAMKRNGFDV